MDNSMKIKDADHGATSSDQSYNPLENTNIEKRPLIENSDYS